MSSDFDFTVTSWFHSAFTRTFQIFWRIVEKIANNWGRENRIIEPSLMDDPKLRWKKSTLCQLLTLYHYDNTLCSISSINYFWQIGRLKRANETKFFVVNCEKGCAVYLQGRHVQGFSEQCYGMQYICMYMIITDYFLMIF